MDTAGKGRPSAGELVHAAYPRNWGWAARVVCRFWRTDVTGRGAKSGEEDPEMAPARAGELSPVSSGSHHQRNWSESPRRAGREGRRALCGGGGEDGSQMGRAIQGGRDGRMPGGVAGWQGPCRDRGSAGRRRGRATLHVRKEGLWVQRGPALGAPSQRTRGPRPSVEQQPVTQYTRNRRRNCRRPLALTRLVRCGTGTTPGQRKSSTAADSVDAPHLLRRYGAPPRDVDGFCR